MFNQFTAGALRVLIGWLLLCGWAAAQSETAALRFKIGGQTVAEWRVEDMAARVAPAAIAFFNPLMTKDKSYRAFPLAALLDAAYGERWRAAAFSDLAFTALDGYEAVSALDKLTEAGGFLAFADLDQESGWEPIGRRRADPGPFFVVWTEKHQTTANAYPWPWQVAEFNLLRFAEQYPAVIPAGVDEDSAAWRGFDIFRYRCLRCHAIDRQGGKVGPDLNAPQSITAYRSEFMIKEFIRQPSNYRHTHMPDHPDLTDRDLDDLFRYLKHQAGN